MQLLRYYLRDVMWLMVVLGLAIAWRADHQRLLWKPSDGELWIPLVELVEGDTIGEMSRILDEAEIPHAIRDTPHGGVRILVTLPDMDAASAAIADHPALAHVQPLKP